VSDAEGQSCGVELRRTGKTLHAAFEDMRNEQEKKAA